MQGDKVNYDRFRNWLLQDKEAFTLSRWLLSGGVCVTLTDDSDTPTFYQTLAGVTHRKATPKTASCSSAPECYVYFTLETLRCSFDTWFVLDGLWIGISLDNYSAFLVTTRNSDLPGQTLQCTRPY